MKPSVVLCDDHRSYAEALALALEAHGYVTTVVTDPDAALGAVGPATGVVLIDHHFPSGAVGVATIAALRRAAPTAKVVLLSGSVSPELAQAAIDEGASAVIGKDGAVSEVLELVDALTGTSPASLATYLTAREREVLAHLVRGSTTVELAAELGISYATARSHIQRILAKLGVHSKLEAVSYAIAHRVVPPPRPAR